MLWTKPVIWLSRTVPRPLFKKTRPLSDASNPHRAPQERGHVIAEADGRLPTLFAVTAPARRPLARLRVTPWFSLAGFVTPWRPGTIVVTRPCLTLIARFIPAHRTWLAALRHILRHRGLILVRRCILAAARQIAPGATIARRRMIAATLRAPLPVTPPFPPRTCRPFGFLCALNLPVMGFGCNRPFDKGNRFHDAGPLARRLGSLG